MLEILIKRAGELTEMENDQIDEAASLAYAGLPAPDYCWSDSEWFVLGKLEGKVVSLFGILCRDVLVGGNTVRLAGVGGVATHPDYQKKGFAGQLLERGAIFMRDQLQVPFGLLVCSEERTAYYAKFGWQPMNAPLYFTCRGERLLLDSPVMILPFLDDPWQEGEVDLQGGPW